MRVYNWAHSSSSAIPRPCTAQATTQQPTNLPTVYPSNQAPYIYKQPRLLCPQSPFTRSPLSSLPFAGTMTTRAMRRARMSGNGLENAGLDHNVNIRVRVHWKRRMAVFMCHIIVCKSFYVAPYVPSASIWSRCQSACRFEWPVGWWVVVKCVG